MNKFFSGLAVVALLLAALAITPPAQAVTVKVHREYGQGPVKMPAGVARAQVTFHGQQGDTVRVDAYPAYVPPCAEQSLRSADGTVEPRYEGVWRLPATGRYTFDYRRCFTQTASSLQLVKLRLRPLTVNGPAVTLRASRGGAFQDVASVRVPESGRVQVRPTSTEPQSDWDFVDVEGAPRLRLSEWHQDRIMRAVYLESGAPVSNDLGTVDPAVVPQAGQRVLLARSDTPVRVRATKSRTTPATVDGPATRVVANRSSQEVGVRFRSTGDQWVTADFTGRLAERSTVTPALLGPDGAPLVGMVQATHNGANLWFLPEPGKYRLMVRTDPQHDVGRVRIQSARVLGAELPTDGQPLAVTAEQPGDRIVVTSAALTEASYRLTSESTSDSRWTLRGAPLPLDLCRSTFCDQPFGFAYQNPNQATSQLQAAGQWLFVVQFAAGRTGTVTMRLAPSS